MIDVDHRSKFADLCNDLGITQAVEIGTDCGEFAVEFLDHWRGHALLCVDNYTTYDDFPWNREGDKMMAVFVLARRFPRCRLLVEDSVRAASFVTQDWPQFVYLDGCHKYEAVRADIGAWWSRLAPGGILSGHDYDNIHPGVIQAVNEFSASEGLHLQCTKEDAPSWYVFKAGVVC